MNILQKANQIFREKNYAKALELFEQAGVLYGPKLVRANILLCKKALEHGKFKSTAKQNIDPIPAIPSGPVDQSKLLDPATRYMLSQMGRLELTEEQKQQCLEQHKQLTSRKSEDAEVKAVKPIPADWPKDLFLAPLPESTNDFKWHLARKVRRPNKEGSLLPGLSVIIPTFNRSNILDVTLACLVNQETQFPFEVIVADDGSQEPTDLVVRKYETQLDIKYVRQRDYGYQLCAVRNLGLRAAKYEYVAILDCDMAPNPKWVASYMELLSEDDDVALIGPRKYVDTSERTAEEFLIKHDLIESLPEVLSTGTLGRSHVGNISIDWRLDHFRKTEDLRLCNTPFRFFSGGNVAFARKWLEKVGWFDEEFTDWGGEDNEFGYRLYRAGCFFRAVWGGLAYHQEPPGKENETDRAEGKKITMNILHEKVPYFYRQIKPLATATLYKKPLVSIYIPAYNCANHIVRCVDSALNQTVVDLEVCICNDGSTDNTLELLISHYGHNPRVRVLTQSNGGIGSASNTAVRMAHGYYIGQLDSDDYLEPDAVELCLRELLADHKLACVYTTNRNVNHDGTLIANGYNWPVFSREKLTTAMIAHHFRMFTARAWHLTQGFDESIANAVDYDMYLKLSEVGPFKHINKISYSRVLHGENISIKKDDIQKKNHYFSVNQSLARQNIRRFKYMPANPESRTDRGYIFELEIK
jgi:chondroitin synthase